MINTNELRKGNLVEMFSRGMNEWEYVELKVQHILNIEQGAEAKPIPLTPEMLERCGFVTDSHRPETLILWVTDNLYYSTLMNAKDCVKLFTDSEGQNGQGRYLEHLHQLQNGYFDLIGEEMKIKSLVINA